MVKTLGVVFGYSKRETKTKNWQAKLDKVKLVLARWTVRDLTFQGRVQIIKSIALPQLVYLLSSLHVHVPNWLKNEVNKEFFRFIWKNKRDKKAEKS